jgi:catechol 2,3-dioxygenase-like lactoylglutathione lyase family enzyme
MTQQTNSPGPRGGLSLRRRSFTGFAPCALWWPSMAGAATAAPAGWHEALLIVPALAPWIETLTTVGGWEVLYHGLPDRSLNQLWALPADALCEQVLMRNIGTRTGYMRLVHVTGAPQTMIRPDDQPWETGGVQALDLRVVDMQAARTALHARGWRAASEPVRYKTYNVEVIQWAPVSPDGIRLSLIQRIAPKLTGWAELKRWSRTMNAAITVADMAAAKTFFGQTLGLKPAFESRTVGGDGPNVMGLPYDVARAQPVAIQGFTGTGGDGSIELLSLPGIHGRDHAAAAHPPNLGIAGLRFTVADGLTHEDAGSPGLRTLTIAPYGACRAVAVSSPDGVWIERVSPV